MNSTPVIEKTDKECMKEGSSLFQSSFWASFKSVFGWQPYYFLINGKNLIVLLRSLKPGFSLAYVPFAPDISEKSNMVKIAETIADFLPKSCLFIRFDLAWEAADLDSGADMSPLVKSKVDIQPPSTVILDLSPSEEEILKGMKSKTRYNIKLSAKKGVSVRRYGIEVLDEWYDIYTETAARDKIALHGLEYYKTLFSLAESEKDSPDLRIYMAETEGEKIAGIVTAFYNNTAVYLYGASRNIKRETMPSYALQWQAICDSKREGCLSYDFFGIPPADDPDHPMHGLYRFKTGFGGEIIHRCGCYDYKLRNTVYPFYITAENARNFYYKKIRKR